MLQTIPIFIAMEIFLQATYAASSARIDYFDINELC